MRILTARLITRRSRWKTFSCSNRRWVSSILKCAVTSRRWSARWGSPASRSSRSNARRLNRYLWNITRDSMSALIARMFKDRRASLLVYCAAGVGFLWMYIAIYPSIAGEAERFNDLFQNYPEGLLKAFGIDQINLSTLENYISMEHFSLIWPLMLIICMISRSEEHTSELQ